MTWNIPDDAFARSVATFEGFCQLLLFQDIVDVSFLVDLSALSLEPEAIELDILYEDDDLLIVNKPSGMVVHPAPGNWTGTLVSRLLGCSVMTNRAGVGGDTQL